MALAPTSTPTGKTVRQKLAALDPTQAANFRSYVNAASAPAPVQSGAIPAFVLPGSAESEYLIGQQNANETYNEGLATNEFQREQLDQSYAPQFRDLALQYGRLRESMPGSYMARGMLGRNNGIWRRGLSDYATDRLNSTNDLEMKRAQGMSSVDFANSQLARRRALELANLGMRHAANLGSAAAGSVR